VGGLLGFQLQQITLDLWLPRMQCNLRMEYLFTSTCLLN